MQKVLARLEPLARLSFLLAAAGYFALRVHHNRLGIPLRVESGAELYIAESAVFAAALLIALVTIAAAAAPLVAVTAVILRASARARDLKRRLGAAGKAFLEGSGGALVIGGGGILLLLGLLAPLGDQTDIVVGPLDPAKLSEPNTYYFLVGVLMVVAALALARLTEPKGEGEARSVASAAYSGLAVASIVALPLLFGQFAHPLKYPFVRTAAAGASTVPGRCGLLIGRSSGEIVLWSSDGRFGMVEALPAAATILQFGQMRDIRTEALYAVDGKVARPGCKGFLPPAGDAPPTPPTPSTDGRTPAPAPAR